MPVQAVPVLSTVRRGPMKGSDMKVKYMGTAPGQAEQIQLGFFVFERGETYDINARAVADMKLRERGGFVVAEAARKPKKQEMNNE